MMFRTSASAVYHCSLERAFKAPMLCDVTKVHTGLGPMPRIVGTSDEHNWGQPGGTKKAYAAKSFVQKGGFVSMDRVVERIENRYWKIEVYDFQAWFFGFYKFVGEWNTTEIGQNTIRIDYHYTLHSNHALFYPVNWLFAKVFWKRYMQQVLENVRKLAEGDEPYQYA
ncbi:MAG: SRPBCC family protein [Bacteroidia bacterium]|nr:SRPBCC family protein [Bacteroidia bacterium]